MIDFKELLIKAKIKYDDKNFQYEIAKGNYFCLCEINSAPHELYERIKNEISVMSEDDRIYIMIDITRKIVIFALELFVEDYNEYTYGGEFALTPEETKVFFQVLDECCVKAKGMTFDQYIKVIQDQASEILKEEAEEKAKYAQIPVTDMRGMFANCKPISEI